MVMGNDVMRDVIARVGIALALVLAFAAAAKASTPLPAAFAETEVFDFPGGPHVVKNGLPTQTSAILGEGSATALGSPTPTVFTFATGAHVVSVSSLTYYFEILGPDGTMPVTVHGAVKTKTSIFGTSFADALFVLGKGVHFSTATGAGLLGYSTCSGSLDCTSYCPTAAPCADVRFNTSIELATNTIYGIFIHSFSQAQGGGYASSVVDPFVTFDFPSADHSFVFSEGISNLPTGGVPEPTAWALMLVGLGLAGATVRRAKQATLRA